MKKDELATLKFIALIGFKLTKGHFLINGNKRIALMVMADMLNTFEFKINTGKEVWKLIYNEWKNISEIKGNDLEKAIDKTYDMLIEYIIRKVED